MTQDAKRRACVRNLRRGRLQERAAILAYLEAELAAYPVDVFPEEGTSVDCISARALRWKLSLLRREIAKRRHIKERR